jgi:hypothetical protein
MPISNHVIRRYTPPTCSLEILAQKSALSRWMGKSVLKQLQFELRFDDPRLPEEQRITIRGEQDQLEALHTAVTNYVQQLLEKSPENLLATLPENKQLHNISDSSQTQEFKNYSVQANTIDPYSTRIPETEIRILPSNSLTHKLFLGSLANEATGQQIRLTLLQLFDLASALDEYSSDALALPNINDGRSSSAFPAWIPVAAVLAIAVGLTPVTWQYAQNARRKQQMAQKSTSASEKVALAPSPSLNFLPTATPSPLLTPPDTLLSRSGSPIPLPANPLPPPPNSTFPGTLPTSPNSGYPVTTGATSPNSTFPKVSIPSATSTLKIPATGTFPSISTSKNTAPTNVQNPQISLIPGSSKNGTGLISRENSQVSLIPTSKKNSTGAVYNQGISPSTSVIPSSSINSAYPETSSTNSRSLTTIPSNLTSVPSSSSPTKYQQSAKEGSIIARLRAMRRNAATEVAANSGTLFDTAQVAQAREYFKQHWKPPADLKQPIQYSLLVGVDGTIEQILPLGKAARDYIDRSGIPLIGEPFVSPNKNGQSVIIRAVLSPDGKVQTFPEPK